MAIEMGELLQRFAPVSLRDMDKAALLNRIDTKYVFDVALLPALLQLLEPDYFVLEINQARQFCYRTLYYDTSSDLMLREHLRGKLNRFKVRHRLYQDSNDSFLEIKRKNNKGRTIKWRIDHPYPTVAQSIANHPFIQKHIPNLTTELHPVIGNTFRRITLTDKDFTQRITIDMDIVFRSICNEDDHISTGKLAIAEVKTGAAGRNCKAKEFFRENKIRPSGFSKYCFGRVMLTPEISKASALKTRLLELHTLLINT